MSRVSVRPEESWSYLAYIYSTICKSVLFTLFYCPLKIAMNFCSQSFLSLVAITYESASWKTNSNSIFPGGLQSLMHVIKPDLCLRKLLWLVILLFHPGRSERSWGLNGAFYLLAPQLEQRLSLGWQLPNTRLWSQCWGAALAANALPQDWGFSHITPLALSPPPSPKVRAVITNFGIAGDWYIH